jgi:plastocyanin
MTMCVRTALGGTLALALAAVSPVAAQAATKTVDMGLPTASQRTFQNTGSDVNDFFPHRVTIHAGDRIRFVPTGFHTVDLPGRRTRKLPIFTPTGQPIAGSTDAAGAPFWFNGQSGVTFNPVLLRSGFGKSFAYTGARAALSGFPLARRPKAMTVRFPRTGTFRYFCDVHLGMTGIVSVVSARRRIPSAAADRATLRRQLATTLRTARALPTTGTVPPNTVDVGRQGAGGVSLLAFLPAALTVPTGTTVTFRMNARSEVHTATTGPGDPENQPTSYLGAIAASLNGPAVDPKAAFPSEPPGALAALTPTFHGNGFWSSGVLDLDSTTATVPPANTVTFAAPGAYQVFCMIHPFMHTTVTVT